MYKWCGTEGGLINKPSRLWSCPKSQKNTRLPLARNCHRSRAATRPTAAPRRLQRKKYTYPVYSAAAGAAEGLIENKSSAARKQNTRRVNLRVNLRLKTFIFFFVSFLVNSVNIFGCINKIPLGEHPPTENSENFNRIIRGTVPLPFYPTYSAFVLIFV